MIKKQFYSLWTTGFGLYVLLGLLFLGIFVSPVWEEISFESDIAAECVFAMILISGVFTTPCSVSIRIGMLLTALLAVITRGVVKFNEANFFIIGVDHLLAIIMLVAFSVLLCRHYLFNRTILRYRIAAAVAVYLILGVLWARFYEVLYLFNPAAFSWEGKMDSFSLTYFSFVTLMTLGYGDIVPLSIAARSLAIFEGIVGQLYMVILISSLVSEFSALAIASSQPSNS